MSFVSAVVLLTCNWVHPDPDHWLPFLLGQNIILTLTCTLLLVCKPQCISSHLALLTGTHASTSDTRKVSFALESEAIIESGVKKDEDAESIKDGGDQDIKLDVITENVQDEEGNECKESHAVATTALEMSAGTTSALEETEEKAKGDHAGQACAEFTSKEQSDNEAGGVVVTVC